MTGASSGIGAATARAVARKGATAVLLARTQAELGTVAAEITAEGGRAHAYAVDCADREAVATVAPRIEADSGVPDVIVNNAGAGRHLFFEETEPRELEEMMGAPFFAAVYVTRAFLPAMIERGSGYIVMVNAPIAFAPWQGAAGYGAARWALRGLSEVLRADLRGTGVNVGHVVAGKVASGYFEHNPGVEQQLPRIGRLTKTLSTDDVAGTIVRAIEGEKRFVVTPLLMAIMMRVAVHFPRLVASIVQRTGVPRPDQT